MKSIATSTTLLLLTCLAGTVGAETAGAKWRPGSVAIEDAGPQEVLVIEEPAWREFELRGPHFFAGVSIGPALTGVWSYAAAEGPDFELGMLFAVRLGLLYNRTELAVEIAPMTWMWRVEPQRRALAANLSVGGLVRLAGNVSWPLRFGLGITTSDLPNGASAYMNGRLDVIGLVYQAGHLLVEVDLPSVRFHSDLTDMGVWNFLFNLSFSYVI